LDCSGAICWSACYSVSPSDRARAKSQRVPAAPQPPSFDFIHFPDDALCREKRPECGHATYLLFASPLTTWGHAGLSSKRSELAAPRHRHRPSHYRPESGVICLHSSGAPECPRAASRRRRSLYPLRCRGVRHVDSFAVKDVEVQVVESTRNGPVTPIEHSPCTKLLLADEVSRRQPALTPMQNQGRARQATSSTTSPTRLQSTEFATAWRRPAGLGGIVARCNNGQPIAHRQRLQPSRVPQLAAGPQQAAAGDQSSVPTTPLGPPIWAHPRSLRD